MLAHRRISWSCALALAILVVACAPSTQPAAPAVPAAAPKAPAQPAAPAAAAPAAAPAAPAAPVAAPAPAVPKGDQPQYGGAVAYATSNPQLNNLEPIQYTAVSTHQIVNAAYSRLVKIDWKDKPENVILAPDLAESWQVSKDGLTLTFNLRKDVRFQNIDPVNGRELTSQDVKYSLERAAYDPGSLFQSTYRNVDRFETPDKYTFVIKMKNVDVELLFLLGANHAWIVPKEVVEKYGNLKTVLIGSGPFIFDRWVKNVGVFFKRNPNYFVKGQPYLDEYHWLDIRDAQTRITAFRTGKTCCFSVGINEFKNISKTNPDVQFIRQLSSTQIGLGMHYGNPIFKDIRLRKALVLALDREKFLQVAYEGDGTLRGPIPAEWGGWFIPQEEQKKLWPHDPAQAKKLLEEAGYKQGLTLELLHSPADFQRDQLAQLIIEWYRQIGITVKLDQYERTTMRRKQDSGDYKHLVIGADSQVTPEGRLTQNFRTGGSKNMSQISDPKLDKWIDDMASTVDNEERRKMALDIQRWIFENYFHTVNFANVYSYDMWQPSLKGYRPVSASASPFDLSIVWVTK